MVCWENLLSVVFAFFVVTVSPGPANIAVTTVAASTGRRNGLLFGAGLSFGLAFWGVVAATGLGAVLQSSLYLLTAVKIFGGLYLMWLAFQSARSAAKKAEDAHDVPVKGRWFTRGLMLNLSNPKAVVAWMAALSMGLGAGDGRARLLVATTVCIALGFANYTGYAIAFSRPRLMTGYKRFRRWVDGMVAGLFAAAGLGLIRSALSR